MALNKPLKDEIVDQVLHFVSNALIVIFLSVTALPLWGCAAIALTYTLGREFAQHKTSMTCKEGCQRDIAFSFLGIAAGVLWVI